jgi:hypothetical protein
MTAHAVLNPALSAQVEQAAATAGLEIAATGQATSFAGDPTTRFTLALKGDSARTLPLELSNSFDPAPPELAAELALFLTETAGRLKNPQPNTLLSLTGIPLTYSDFQWPFHESTAGADTSVVHGQIHLADGTGSPLHAKIAAAMTVTFREIVKAPEQPFAESPILNAVRKTLDQGQLELVKSGNRQPVPVTTRYYLARLKKFVFNDTTEPERREFLTAKAFWMSGVLGAGAPVWLLDPRDAQYLNTTVADLKISLEALGRDGVVELSADPAYASASAALMAQREHFEEVLAEALRFIKPSFNEEMRAGHTNM